MNAYTLQLQSDAQFEHIFDALNTPGDYVTTGPRVPMLSAMANVYNSICIPVIDRHTFSY